MQKINQTTNTQQRPNLSGTQVEMQSFAFLSDSQLLNSGIPIEIQDDCYGEVLDAMLNPIIKKCDLDLDCSKEDYDVEYLDITVDIENSTYTLHGVYKANVNSYSFSIVSPIKVNSELPLTLPLPSILLNRLSANSAETE
jgi:hypothetical protein